MGKKLGAMTDFIFLGFKITVGGYWSWEVKRHLFLWKKSYDKPREHTKKQRHHLANKGPYSRENWTIKKFFPIVTYRCESWTIKKVELWRIDVFELWCWRTLESPVDCKEIQPVHPKGDQSWILEGLMLKLILQYFGHLMQRTNALKKTLMLGQIEGRRRRRQQRVRWLDGIMASLTCWT